MQGHPHLGHDAIFFGAVGWPAKVPVVVEVGDQQVRLETRARVTADRVRIALDPAAITLFDERP